MVRSHHTVTGKLGPQPGSTHGRWPGGTFVFQKLCVRRVCPSPPRSPRALLTPSYWTDRRTDAGPQATHSSTVKHTRRRWRPSARCFSRASRPRKGTADLSLQVKAKPASRGLSSGRRSACQCR